MDYMSIKQTARIRYKTEDNPPMEGVPLLGYSKKYDCWVALVYRKGDNYYTNMECDVEYKTSPPDEYEYVYPRELEGIYLYLSMINIIFILFMLLFLFKSYFCINIKNQIIMDGDKQKVNELTMRTLGSHYGGYAYVKVKNRQTDVKIDWKLLRAIEKGEVEIDNEKYHLSGIEYVAKRYQDMFYAGRDIYYFKGMGGHGMTDLLRNAIDDLLDTISSRETYRSAEHRVYAQMNKLTEAGAMISLAIELLTSNIRHSYGEINFERHPRPVEVEGEDKH